VGGHLNFHDDPRNTSTGGSRRVQNRLGWQAHFPWAAHTEYWTDRLLGDIIYQLL